MTCLSSCLSLHGCRQALLPQVSMLVQGAQLKLVTVQEPGRRMPQPKLPIQKALMLQVCGPGQLYASCKSIYRAYLPLPTAGCRRPATPRR